ncbi:hypothetical protein Pmgp_02015 [Pelotomaculum propionicicum]|uniref:Uncharacterized protein n=1 Tax=Pelotomaculum propionicicum TaxID=258475 RepID=A0A4Y7RQ62_9FIRM|nr:hypothetical protein Pmgp_02015 [Pelotomaculum propionicicum]
MAKGDRDILKAEDFKAIKIIICEFFTKKITGNPRLFSFYSYSIKV